MENLFLLVICVLQTFFAALAMRPMVKVVGAVHSSSRYLYRAQPHLDATSVAIKLKLATHYEVVNGGEKFTFTVGPVGKITTEAFFEVREVTAELTFLNLQNNFFYSFTLYTPPF